MAHEVKIGLSNSTSAAPAQDRSEKISVRTRGSSSPFRCISNLVQQMNLEKDQELSATRLRIEELEAVLASRQKEVKCNLVYNVRVYKSHKHSAFRIS